MDEYDFEKIDKEIEIMLEEMANAAIEDRLESENPPVETTDIRPLQHEWIPVGPYDGIDIPGIDIDEDYITWQQIKCPEYDCEVVI